MYFGRLNEQNVEQYIDYLKLAMQQEPDMMTVEEMSIIFMGVYRMDIAWRM